MYLASYVSVLSFSRPCTAVPPVHRLSFPNLHAHLCMFEFQTVDVQPNDGFGTLLPLESFDVDIMFNAKKAKVGDR